MTGQSPRFRIGTLVGLFMLGAAGILSATASAAGATYYVDFTKGADANDGRSTDQPFQHCPGNGTATGLAQATRLQPNDTVIFKGGVNYAETLHVAFSGTQGQPITYDGNSSGKWGIGQALIDGQGAIQCGIVFDNPSKGQGKQGPSFIVIDNFEIRDLRRIYEDSAGQDPFAIVLGSPYRGDAPNHDIEIRNCWLHDIHLAPKPVAREAGQVHEGIDTLSDSGRDFSAYATSPGKQPTCKINLFWNNGGMNVCSDYDRAWGYIGQAAGDNHTIDVYKDMALTKPGWNGYSKYLPGGMPARVGYDLKPAGAMREYYLYDMNKGSYDDYCGYGIITWATSHCVIRNCKISDAKYLVMANGSDFDIEHCDFSATNVALAGAASNIKFHDNAVHDTRQFGGDAFGFHFDHIHIWNSDRQHPTTGFECYYNVFKYDCPGTAVIYLEYNVSGPKIYSNYIENSSGGKWEPSSYIQIAGKGYLDQDHTPAEIHDNTLVGRGIKAALLIFGAPAPKVENNHW